MFIRPITTRLGAKVNNCQRKNDKVYKQQKLAVHVCYYSPLINKEIIWGN